MMKMRQLIVAAVVLAALGATLYWSNHRKPSDDASNSSTSPTFKIISLKQEDVSKLEVKKSGGEDIVLARGADKWKITSPTSLFADQDTVSAMLYALSPLDNATLIEEKPGDLKAYGLADPTAAISATTKDGKTQTILVGDDTPTGSAAYAALSGDPKVYSISTGTKSSLNKGLSDLRDKRLLPVDFEKLSAVEVSGPKLKLVFGSDNGQWIVRNPKNVRGDTSKLENIVEKLKLADVDPSTPEEEKKKAASLFASGSGVATVKATDASGTQQLEVRKNKTAYYVKTTAMDGAYKVADALGESLDKTIDDIREKRLFDFAQQTPEKIEFHDASKNYLLTQSSDDWWMDGKKMDPLSADAVLRSIRQLTAAKFVSTGFNGSGLTLTVTSKGGKLIEKVDFSKASGGYIAKRDDGATLYELDAKQVEELQKNAADLKPAETAPVKK